MRDDSVLGNDHNPIPNIVIGVVHIFRFADRRDHHVVPDAGIFIHDGIFDPAIGPDSDARFAGFFMLGDRFVGFVIVAAQHDRPIEHRAWTYQAAHADNAVHDHRPIQDAAIGNNGMIYL